MKSAVFLCIGLLFAAQIFGQSEEETSLKNRPFQLSFFYPLGTNGVKSGQISNHVSVNVLVGYNGGLKGVEFGSLFNILRYDGYGAQFAGLGNIVAGTTHGLQAGGLFNISAQGMRAFQTAGLFNVSTKHSKGAQVAGLVNIAAGSMNGIQIAGLVNFAGKLQGLQLGFLNIADTVERGIPIGFLSIVRKGYFRAEVGANETLNGVLSLKIGVSRFYNIFSVGIKSQGDDWYWALGYGIGTQLPRRGRFSFNLDAISYQIFDHEFFEDNNLNLLNKLRASIGLHLSRHLVLYGGISANVWVANTYDAQGEWREPISPWATFDRVYRDTRVQIYPGFHVGVRL